MPRHIEPTSDLHALNIEIKNMSRDERERLVRAAAEEFGDEVASHMARRFKLSGAGEKASPAGPRRPRRPRRR